jgi:hypothetical protein
MEKAARLTERDFDRKRNPPWAMRLWLTRRVQPSQSIPTVVFRQQVPAMSASHQSSGNTVPRRSLLLRTFVKIHTPQAPEIIGSFHEAPTANS